MDASLPVAYTNTYSIANRDTSGSDGTAYKKLSDALAAAASGATLTLRSGTYAETTGGSTAWLLAKPITIQNYSGESSIVTYASGSPPIVNTSDYGPIITIAASNVTLDGLTIIGTHDLGDSPGGNDTDVNITLSGTPGGTVIRRCTLQKWGHAGIKFGTGGNGGTLLIERNHIQAGGFTERDHGIYVATGSAPPAFAYDTTIRLNEISGAYGYGIQCYSDPQNVKMYGNVIHHNGTNPANGGGILLGGTGNEVYNNTIVDNIGYGGIVFWKQIVGYVNIVKNNILRGNTTDVRLDASNGTNTVGHNNKHTIAGSNYSDGGTDVDTDPLFTSGSPATWTDYRLQGGSTMIAAGEAQSSPYDQALDPAQTTTPTAKTQSSPPTIGGFTT